MAGAASGDADAAVAAAEAAEEAAIVVQRLEETSATLRSSGWIAFWAQLVCSVVSTVILLFSLAFEKVSLPGQLGLGLTVAGVGMAFLSTFAAYSLMLLGRALGRAAESGGEGAASKGQVVGRLVKMCYVNVIGMGATVAGAEAVIGLLVGKSLTSATTALFQNGMYNYQPVLPLDIFLVQASINTIVAHFVGLVSSLYLLQKITAPKPVAKAA
eukprot:PRCOL_00004645-RA